MRTVRFLASVPARVQDEAGLVRELGVTVGALVALLLVVHGVVVVEVGARLERGAAHVAHKWPVVRVHQRVPLQQLLVLEALVAHAARVQPPFAVNHLSKTTIFNTHTHTRTQTLVFTGLNLALLS